MPAGAVGKGKAVSEKNWEVGKAEASKSYGPKPGPGASESEKRKYYGTSMMIAKRHQKVHGRSGGSSKHRSEHEKGAALLITGDDLTKEALEARDNPILQLAAQFAQQQPSQAMPQLAEALTQKALMDVQAASQETNVVNDPIEAENASLKRQLENMKLKKELAEMQGEEIAQQQQASQQLQEQQAQQQQAMQQAAMQQAAMPPGGGGMPPGGEMGEMPPGGEMPLEMGALGMAPGMMPEPTAGGDQGGLMRPEDFNAFIGGQGA